VFCQKIGSFDPSLSDFQLALFDREKSNLIRNVGEPNSVQIWKEVGSFASVGPTFRQIEKWCFQGWKAFQSICISPDVDVLRKSGSSRVAVAFGLEMKMAPFTNLWDIPAEIFPRKTPVRPMTVYGFICCQSRIDRNSKDADETASIVKVAARMYISAFLCVIQAKAAE
jgi:hypothetical protein